MPPSPRLALACALAAVGCGDAAVGAPGTASSGVASAPASPPSAADAATVASAPSQAGSAASAEPAPPDGMVVVPAGFFLMGGESPENTPQHEVAVGRFALDRTEVRMRDYAACVAAGQCEPPAKDNPFCNVLFSDREEHPVNCVDFDDASAYCRFVGKRLPTEREWEYAARGGAEQRLYSWGNDEPTGARACYMHGGGSCPVGAYAEGAFGLLDMTGNVWEWTSSFYGPYPDEPTGGAARVYRGGSWSRRFAKWMRNDLRNRYAPHEHSASLGFRCAKDLEPLACAGDAEARDGRCVRVHGTPLCPRGEAFAAGACRPGGIVPAWLGPDGAGNPSGRLPGAPSGSPTTLAEALPEAPAAPPRMTRSPGVDGDCQRNFPDRPQGFQITGGTFHDREPLVRSSGCKKRDVSVTWTSVCCP